MLNKICLALANLTSRIIIGILFINSGWGKFHNLENVISYFQSLEIPMAYIQAPIVAGIELVAGLLILLGFMARYASLPLVGIMFVAIKTAKWEDISDFTSLVETSEFLYILILLWLIAQVETPLSLDSIYSKFFKKTKKVN